MGMKFLGYVVQVGGEKYMWGLGGGDWGKDITWKT